MDYVNYYITMLIISVNLYPSTSITNTGRGDGSSIPKDFKRHIGLAPETNWEPGLREAVHQSLLKEHVTLVHLREKILQAPMSGQGDKVSPFGDVAILARGQLFANPSGFRFVQEPHPNDCIDCHELRQCYGKECEIYLHNGLGERLIALWTVKRLRHRNPEVRYELEYSVSPIRKHVWVTKNGGYDYSVPGHVFVVKTGHSPNGYQHHDKFADLPHYPHPPIPPKIHSNKHPFGSKPGFNAGEWVQINQPPPLLAPPAPVPDKLPNYYLPQKPGKPGEPDQTASTSLKEVQPTLDYAEIEAYKNLLQVLHQKTSTTEQKVKPTRVPTTKATPPSAATLPTRPPLSHTTWFIPMTSTKKIPTTTNRVTRPTSSSTSTSISTSTAEVPRTTKVVATIKTPTVVFTRPVTTSLDTTKPTYFTSTGTRPGTTSTTSSFRPTPIQDYSTKFTTSAQQSTRPQTIYQQLGGFDSSKSTSPTSTLAMTSLTTQTRPSSTHSATYPIKTTIPMAHQPTQPSFSSDSTSSHDTTKVRETTQPMTTSTTSRRQPKPTKPMTTVEARPTKPFTTVGVEWTRPADGQTTSTFLFPTKVTPPFGLGLVTKPIRLPGITQSQNQNTISTYPGKETTFTYGTNGGKGSTIPMRYPTTSTFPGSTFPGTYRDTTIPVRGTVPGITPPFGGIDQGSTTPGRGTEPSTTTQFGGSTSTSGTRYPPTNQYLPSTTSVFSRPTTLFTDGTIGTTIHDHRTTPGTTYLPGSTTPFGGGGSDQPTRPTGLLETTKITGGYPTTTGYERPRPTFFIDPTHPGYPKTTPTTPFTDGQAFKPSPPDPVYHPLNSLPPLTRPSTIYTPPTRPTISLTDFTNTDSSTSSGGGTTLLIPASTDRYTPPSTAHSHTISLPTKLPKPSTPFKVPPIDDYDAELFPRDPNEVKSTTTTRAPSTVPVGDFILPEENYQPHPLVPELNPVDVEVFDKVAPATSTTEAPTSTINPVEIKEVFDSSTFKPKPPIDESDFDEFFKQETTTSTVTSIEATKAKVIYSDFFEASTAPPTQVLQAFTTVPSTRQSFSTSVSIEVNNKNKQPSSTSGAKPKIVKKLKFRKAKVKELPRAGEYKVYKAEHPEGPEFPHEHEYHQTQDLVENIEVTHRGNNEQRKYGPNGRKYKQNNKLKATSTASTGVTKAFDDLALQLVNHARTIDYLENREDLGPATEQAKSKGKPQSKRTGSNTNLQNRNKYKRKSYGRVRKVKKRTDNKAIITRTNRGAIKASTAQNTTTEIVKTVENIDNEQSKDVEVDREK